GIASTILNNATTIYVADTDNDTIRRIDFTGGGVLTVLGSPQQVGSQDQEQGQNTARFNRPQGIAVCGSDVYIADTDNSTIRRWTPSTGAVVTVAGSAGLHGYAIGSGSAVRFNRPTALACSGSALYVADTENHVVRKLDISVSPPTVSLVAGQPGVYGYS